MLNGFKTYIGLLVAAIPTIAGFFGYAVTVDGAEELGSIVSTLLDNLDGIITTGGILFAAYGRLVTKANAGK